MPATPKLKKLRDQVIVITGASSGIGLVTAKLAAERGAAVVLTARDAPALEEITTGICRNGGRAGWITADVADLAAVERVRDFALGRFGRIDTWINNAGIHIFGKVEDTGEEDARRVVDVNYWGTVHGCRAALPWLKRHGGALINIGSVLSSRSVPLQGFYCASKHAVQGYTDALRVELARDGAPVSVTLVKPSSIDTPIPRHSKNLMKERARLPFPMYDPKVAATAILHCAEHPRRDMIIGGAGKIAVIGEKFLPFFTDFGMRRFLFRMQKTKGEPRREDSLHETLEHPPRARGSHHHHVFHHSLYTWSTRHRALALSAGAAALAAGGLLLKRRA
jgi:short-subunit dehydrogenase